MFGRNPISCCHLNRYYQIGAWKWPNQLLLGGELRDVANRKKGERLRKADRGDEPVKGAQLQIIGNFGRNASPADMANLGAQQVNERRLRDSMIGVTHLARSGDHSLSRWSLPRVAETIAPENNLPETNNLISFCARRKRNLNRNYADKQSPEMQLRRLGKPDIFLAPESQLPDGHMEMTKTTPVWRRVKKRHE